MNISTPPHLLATLLCICTMLTSSSLYADDEIPLSKIKAECARVQKTVKSELVPIALMKSSSCDAEQMYYDLKDNLKVSPADWDKARACADSNHDAGILLMMYANGFGEKRNRDAALFYACDEFGPKFGVQEYVQPVFHKLLKRWDDGKELDTCDYASNRLDMGYCFVWRQNDVMLKYNNQLDRIALRMTPAQKKAFAKLRNEVEDYASTYDEEARGGPLSDTGYPVRPTSPRDQDLSPIVSTEYARQQLLDDVQKAERGEFPVFSRDDFIRLDRSLNAVYRNAFRNAPKADDTDDMDAPEDKITLRLLERKWLRYRDAWVAFAQLRYPKVPAYAWKARLTMRRRDLLPSQ